MSMSASSLPGREARSSSRPRSGSLSRQQGGSSQSRLPPTTSPERQGTQRPFSALMSGQQGQASSLPRSTSSAGQWASASSRPEERSTSRGRLSPPPSSTTQARSTSRGRLSPPASSAPQARSTSRGRLSPPPGSAPQVRSPSREPPWSSAPGPATQAQQVPTTGWQSAAPAYSSQLDNRHVTQQNEIDTLKQQLAAARRAEVHHKNQSQIHLDRLSFLERKLVSYQASGDAEWLPLKERHVDSRRPWTSVANKMAILGFFMLLAILTLPFAATLIMLWDQHYMFWLGPKWPGLVLLALLFEVVLFIVTCRLLMKYASLEHRDGFTMSFTWGVFCALLGVIFVPMSMLAKSEITSTATRISMGCMNTLPESHRLLDYSQVLYNMRLEPSCMMYERVDQCDGWYDNRYTDYLRFLEEDFQCGPLCPEEPPPPQSVVAPRLDGQPSLRVNEFQPPAFGSPYRPVTDDDEDDERTSWLQTRPSTNANAAGRRVSSDVRKREASFLELERHSQGEQHREERGSGAGPLSPHLQAQSLFRHGVTHLACYPLVATRLQVCSKFLSGLLFSEGLGLIVVSLIISLYTAMEYAFYSKSKLARTRAVIEKEAAAPIRTYVTEAALRKVPGYVAEPAASYVVEGRGPVLPPASAALGSVRRLPSPASIAAAVVADGALSARRL